MEHKVIHLSDRELSVERANSLYEEALVPGRSPLGQVIYSAWVIAGLGSLIALAWFGPFSNWLFDWLIRGGAPTWTISFVVVPLVMAFRAVLLVESLGYAYHRFFQHVGFFTRRSQVFRRNQRFHWMHHMVIYPIGTVYKRARKYIPAEKGVGWSWVLPGVIAAGLFLLTHGVNLGSILFIVVLGVYAKFIVDRAHARFHVENHPWADSQYFHWLEDIHVLHHWDQRKNFTIVHPLMDMVFGTYLSPRGHENELEIAQRDEDLTVSDLINWRYVLVEATPAERAAFISNVKHHSASLRKMRRLVKVLDARTESNPDDEAANDLRRKAEDLFAEIGKPAYAAA